MRRFLGTLTWLALALGGCGGGASRHCANGDGDELTTCYESAGGFALGPLGAAGTGLALTTLCALIDQNPAPGPCPDDGKVGGCLDQEGGFTATNWSYTGTLDDIACSSDEVRVGPDGEPVDDDSVVDDALTGCSGDSTVPVTFTLVNQTEAEVTLVWVDRACEERQYAVLPADGRHEQPSFVSHVWIARDGAGAVLWEHPLAADDDGQEFTVE